MWEMSSDLIDAEMLASVGFAGSPELGAAALTLFRAYDTDSSGTITLKEQRQAHERWREVRKVRRVRRITDVMAADTDADGEVSVKEFLVGWTEDDIKELRVQAMILSDAPLYEGGAMKSSGGKSGRLERSERGQPPE